MPIFKELNIDIPDNIGCTIVLVLVEDLEMWCKLYDLEVFETICPDCGSIKNVDIPFASSFNKRRGLVAKRCICGSSSGSFSFVELDTNSDLNKLIR